MRFREHRHDTSSQHEDPPQITPAGGSLPDVRQTGQSLLDAADEAIRRALSGDSRAFLEATRQEGGQ